MPAGAGYAELAQAWAAAIHDHPLCYLRHRAAVFEHQMGFAERIFIPTHSGIDRNDYGIAFRPPGAAAMWINFVETGAHALPRRPFWLYILAAVVTMFVVAGRKRSVPIVLLLGFGAVLYVASFFLLAPVADARYIFPSNIFYALLLAVVLATAGRKDVADGMPAR